MHGSVEDEPAVMTTTTTVELDPLEWKVLLAMKEELTDRYSINAWVDRKS